MVNSAVAVVAENEEFYSAGLAAVLKQQVGYPTVLRVKSLDHLFAISAKVPVDLAILAEDLLGSDGVEAVRQFHAQYPTIPVAVFARSPEAGQVLGWLAAGAHGVILKRNFDGEQLVQALRAIRDEGIFVPALAELEDSELGHGTSDAPSGLTERQRQVIKLLSKGYPNKLIARELGISPCTVKVHVHAAFRALGVHSRVAAVAAVRHSQPQTAPQC